MHLPWTVPSVGSKMYQDSLHLSSLASITKHIWILKSELSNLVGYAPFYYYYLFHCKTDKTMDLAWTAALLKTQATHHFDACVFHFRHFHSSGAVASVQKIKVSVYLVAWTISPVTEAYVYWTTGLQLHVFHILVH